MDGTQAWPYAVTRGEKSGYQAIVVPGFLADTGQGYVLEYASREPGEPGAVTVREVLGATPRPLSLAYRVTEARADRYGLGGEGLLEDRAGRTIRVFEGLVLQLPAGRVASLGLTADDLETVTGVTVPAFRKLWAAGTRIDAEPSAAIRVGGDAPRARPVNLRIAEPYVVPGSDRRRGTRDLEHAPARTRGAPDDNWDYLPVKRPAGGGSAVPGEARPGRARPGRARLITAAAVIGALVLLGWLLARLLSPSAPPPAPPPGPHPSATLKTTKAVHLDLQSQSGRWRVTAMKVNP
jgi:hypothetical protein